MKKKYIVFLSVLWIIVGVTGWGYFSYAKDHEIKTIENNINIEQEKKQEKVSIYLPSKDGKTLVKEEAEIDSAQSRKDRIAKIAIKTVQLLNERGFIESKEISLFNVYLAGETIYLDFSAQIKELDDNSQKSLMNIYSIVNSITEIGGFNRVKIMVNGKDGSKNLGKFYNRNTSI